MASSLNTTWHLVSLMSDFSFWFSSISSCTSILALMSAFSMLNFLSSSGVGGMSGIMLSETSVVIKEEWATFLRWLSGVLVNCVDFSFGSSSTLSSTLSSGRSS